jgi:hypothetical protein
LTFAFVAAATFAAGATGFDFGDFSASLLSVVLFAEEAVGFIIRSKNELPTGPVLFRLVAVESREAGRAGRDARGAVLAVVVGFGRDAAGVRDVDGAGIVSGSCFALDEAVGAVK